MSDTHARAVVATHELLFQARRESNRYRELAELMAEALDAEVSVRFKALDVDPREVHAQTARCLRLARSEGLLA